MRTLLAAQADMRARDNFALLTAAKRGHGEIVRLLLQHGADKLLVNADGRTPLELAKTDAIAALLRSWGASIARLEPADIALNRSDIVV